MHESACKTEDIVPVSFIPSQLMEKAAKPTATISAGGV
jgi:hypothetical protein